MRRRLPLNPILVIVLFAAIFNVQSASAYTIDDHEKKTFKVSNIPHRGASGYAPEHSLPAYRLGIKMGGDFIEMDVQMSRDGQLIVFHDEKVDRTTNSTGSIKFFSLNDLKKLDAGSWFNKANPDQFSLYYYGLSPLTIEEVLTQFGRSTNYFIELKSPQLYPGIEEKLLSVLQEYNLLGNLDNSKQVIIQSFNKNSLKRIKKMNPNIHLVQLVKKDLTQKEIKDIKTYAMGVGIDYRKLTQPLVSSLKKKNLGVYTYTVNKEEEMKKLVEWGVSGIFTDYPDILTLVVENN